MSNCLFCSIVAGSIPAYTVWEDGKVVAFLDIFPVVGGHTLIVPKVHSQNFLELKEDLWASLGLVAQRVAQAHLGLGAKGTNLFVTQGEAAGQSVFHTHWHCVPRYKGDGLHLGLEGKEGDERELKVWQTKLRVALGF